MNKDEQIELGVIALVLILSGTVMLISGLSGCTSQQQLLQLPFEKSMNLTIDPDNLTLNIQDYDKPLALVIKGNNNSIRILAEVQILRIQFIGHDNTIYVNKLRTFQIEDNNQGNKVIYYEQ